MKKICFIVQRYGLEVNGGAELLCRQFAEHMSSYYDVTVLTSKALDYLTWENWYNHSDEELNRVHVKRFSVLEPRNINFFNKINKKFLDGKVKTHEQELEWLTTQGPVVPGLLQFLKDNYDNYKAFLFFTYLYYPTVLGLTLVKNKAILIPTTHKEPYLEMEIYKKLFLSPKGIFYNTREEKYLTEFYFQNEQIPNVVGGIGIDIVKNINPTSFKKKYKLNQYFIYAGRIDTAKGCEQLFHYFIKYKKRNPGEIKLVLIGKAMIEIPKHNDIISLGFISEQEKYEGMSGAISLILPSEYESLSIVVLESLSLGKPVIVNGKCDVLTGHCLRSNAGLYYNSYAEFEGILNYFIRNKDIVFQLGILGKNYVIRFYQWEIIEKQLQWLIEL